MKYLMIDTNIYIDMVVARNQSHKPESYNHLMKLLNYGEIRVIVPKIVITEIFRHLDNEIDKISQAIKGIKGTINSLYWVNNIKEIEQFNEKLKPVKKGINDLNDEFEHNQNKYKENSIDLFNKLFHHENTVIIDESEEIVFKATQRKIHKLRPFHYGKDKDSMADSIIVETLINIKDLMTFNNDDVIYFISKNPRDFSAKEDKNLLHKDITLSLESKEINNQIHYRLLFTKTLLEDFKDETKHVGLIEELETEEEWEKAFHIQESIDLEIEMRREAGGLSSLSANYDEKIAELEQIQDFIDKLEQFQTEIVVEYDNYSVLYSLLDEELGSRNFEEVLELASNFNRQKPLFELDLEDCKDKADLANEIYSLVHELCFNNDEIELDDMFKYQDHFELNTTLAEIKDFNGTQYRIDINGDLRPFDGESDLIFLPVYRDNQKIEEGRITLNYGFLEFDDNGNVGDGSEELIDVYIENVIKEIECIKNGVVSEIVKNKKVLKRIIETLGIAVEE
ncbi:PIN domain-containing protein [Peribacillus simplex]|uniref:PIN domain-containing protein n=1 Tax=Peribacillus simplex TaxID=1478 RepID=UPI0025A044D4|nr:PIN domain-containing protein [Peribacillus simplex]MDM5296387.1 PIN domain-containing protein [Peribacillus simplex]